VVAGELTYRIYDMEPEAMMYLDLAPHAQSQTDSPITSWQFAVKEMAEPAKCLAAVQSAGARDWTPFEMKRVGPKDLVRSAGAHDWVRCFARRAAMVAIATVVVPHGDDTSQAAVKAAGRVALEALWRITPSATAR
jgi:hypothetical protein